MKKLLIVMLLLGITIYLNAETGMGFVFTNSVKGDGTLLAFPSKGYVIFYADDAETIKIEYKDFMESIDPLLKERIKDATSAIIKLAPPKKEKTPGIAY